MHGLIHVLQECSISLCCLEAKMHKQHIGMPLAPSFYPIAVAGKLCRCVQPAPSAMPLVAALIHSAPLVAASLHCSKASAELVTLHTLSLQLAVPLQEL